MSTPAPTRTAQPEVADVLTDARVLVANPRTWLKGQMRNPHRTKFCAYGAVLQVAGPISPLSRRALTVLSQALPEEVTGTRSVVGFNDDPKTKHADVLALFDRAISVVSS